MWTGLRGGCIGWEIRNGSAYASRGAYNGLPQESEYFFQLDNVGGGSNACCLLWATYAGVDTTLADS
ncbi:hypothetical protein [Streptomyces sp. NBC_00316]|uniref:hypothetical protein n=1 Tax=Streptomyces sp. NBC_00316 TaxID=2975710 RepID=UPI002E2D0E57|nr:hypothetical protein [Streptomyces sp. NBC_00316]